ncbi:universal stress protein E [Pseudomonas sp. NFACC02]|uniref:universal stress protein n=1 Tax=Pseudomonas sp. NFACC02 TaxID=1566250 RepID=UPI0008BBACBC|nr:universal stress protein [Pseudomonas sp. NFACC02]SEQ15838.1 universal stress protein E [Pseudomonas sp. NFACC02]
MVESERLMLIASPIMHKTPAFERAGALAKAKEAPLHIVAFDYVDGLATAGLVNEEALVQMREGYVQRHRDWLEEQAESIRQTGVRVTTEVVWVMRAFTEIMVHIRELNPSLVIKDLEHESWITRAMFTSLDLRLLYECPVPLHLVSRLTHAKPRKVLAAVDPFRPDEQFDDINGEIITAAEKLAAQCDAELHLVYAYDLSYVFASGGYDGFSSVLAQQLYDADALAFRKLVERFGVPGNRQHLMMGSPAKQIEALVRSEGIDVVVMGTVHRRHTLRLLGSTTEQVAYHVPCSLLTVKPSAPEA